MCTVCVAVCITCELYIPAATLLDSSYPFLLFSSFLLLLFFYFSPSPQNAPSVVLKIECGVDIIRLAHYYTTLMYIVYWYCMKLVT